VIPDCMSRLPQSMPKARLCSARCLRVSWKLSPRAFGFGASLRESSGLGFLRQPQCAKSGHVLANGDAFLNDLFHRIFGLLPEQPDPIFLSNFRVCAGHYVSFAFSLLAAVRCFDAIAPSSFAARGTGWVGRAARKGASSVVGSQTNLAAQRRSNSRLRCRG
jgi:hypothetical protein